MRLIINEVHDYRVCVYETPFRRVCASELVDIIVSAARCLHKKLVYLC